MSEPRRSSAETHDALLSGGPPLIRSNCYVLTGGVGFGKTALIAQLCQAGAYSAIPEFAAELIFEQISLNGDLLPWKGTDSFLAFEAALLSMRVEAYLSMPDDRLVFADRGIADAIPFFAIDGVPIPEFYLSAARRYRYNRRVFLVPPWAEIYVQTPVRPQTFDESARIGQLVIDTYRELGYELIEVPRTGLPDRAKFVLANL